MRQIEAARPRFSIHLIAGEMARRDGWRAVEAALGGGIDYVQVREKGAPAADLYAAALEVGRLCRRAGAGFLVNDRLDVALAAGADGVHLAKRSLPPAAVRPLLRPGMILGCSVHSLEEAVAAAEGGAGYLTFGHVHPTSSHPGQPPRGVSELARVVRAVPVPVLAIGGISPDNAGPVLATGCAGIVVISAILSESDPARAARVLREAVDSFHHRPRFPFPGAARAGESKK